MDNNLELDTHQHPIPSPKGNTKYPFGALLVNESFFIAGEKDTHRVLSAANRWTKNHSGKFTARTVSGGVRVWRTE